MHVWVSSQHAKLSPHHIHDAEPFYVPCMQRLHGTRTYSRQKASSSNSSAAAGTTRTTPSSRSAPMAMQLQQKLRAMALVKVSFMPLLEVLQFEDGCMSGSQVSMPSCPHIIYMMLNLFMCLACRGCMAQEHTHGRRPAAATAVQQQARPEPLQAADRLQWQCSCSRSCGLWHWSR